jgi:hypothetical protein
MAGLSRKTTGPPAELAPLDKGPANAGANGQQQDLVNAACRSLVSLRQKGSVGIIAHGHPAVLERSPKIKADASTKVGGTPKVSRPIHQPGETDAHWSIERSVESSDEVLQRAKQGVGALRWRWCAEAAQDVSVSIEQDTEKLGAADVDPKRQVIGTRIHEMLSTLALSSCNAVD